jgi:O-antigen/teichoic acid export membrane protein
LIEHLKRLGGDSLLYAFMNVGTKLIAFLMLPVYTAYLGATEMGVLENIDAFTAMLTFLVIFGTDSALAFYYFDTDKQEEKVKYFQNVLLFRLFVALFFLLISFIGGSILAKLILGTTGYEHIVQIALFVLVAEAAITLVLTYYRFEFQSKKVVFTTIFKLGMIALLSYLFLRFWLPDVEAIFYARIVSVLLVFIFLLPQLKKFFTLSIDRALLKEVLKYAAPLVPASIAFWVISTSNRFFLSQFDSLAQVGVYGVAVKFATVITLLTSSVQMAWRPYSMSIKDRSDAKNIFANIYLIVFAVGMLGLIGIATFIPYILKWMIPNPEFHEAGKYIPILSLGTFLNFYYLIISVGLFIKKETKPISIYFGIAAIISVILNLVFIPTLSLWGATLAVVISYLFACVAIFVKSQKVYYVPVSVWKLILMFAVGLASLIFIIYVQEYSHMSKWYLLIPWAVFIVTTVPMLLKRKEKRMEEAN